jgi:uncharacterized protein YaiL (DUF2058 family)
MSNPFQDQLLKAGLVTKKQVQKARQEKNRNKKKQQHSGEKAKAVDENSIKLQQAAEEKAKRDRELNRKKQEQARQKAISIEINQLISSNCLARDEACEIVYNFEHDRKIRRIYVNQEMKDRIINGSLGIARIEGRYELVPKDIAEKIRQRNAKRIVLFSDEEESSSDKRTDQEEPYAGYEVPDDLMW